MIQGDGPGLADIKPVSTVLEKAGVYQTVGAVAFSGDGHSVVLPLFIFLMHGCDLGSKESGDISTFLGALILLWDYNNSDNLIS